MANYTTRMIRYLLALKCKSTKGANHSYFKCLLRTWHAFYMNQKDYSTFSLAILCYERRS